jgi:very-short-patch-repair endonuclease
MLCERFNPEVMGRQLHYMQNKGEWKPGSAICNVAVIQKPAIFALGLPDRLKVAEATEHFRAAFEMCESPLEEVLLMAVASIPLEVDFFCITGAKKPCVGAWPRCGVEIDQQVTIGAYRVDFLFRCDSGKNYVVEVDGHAYHSSRDALQRDKSRDRNLQQLGYSVLRFTYEDVWPRPFAAAAEIHAIITRSEARSA